MRTAQRPRLLLAWVGGISLCLLIPAAADPFQLGNGQDEQEYARAARRKIVYIVDASGSMLDTFPFVIFELKRSISELHPAQPLTVIFFQGDEVLEPPPLGLKTAFPRMKQRLIQWIDPSSGNVTPRGRGNPVEAIRRALAYEPTLVFLLSDDLTGRGRFELDQDRLLKQIREMNNGQVRISTIQFLHPDPLERNGRHGMMKRIAEENGGLYKFVDGRELGIQIQ